MTQISILHTVNHTFLILSSLGIKSSINQYSILDVFSFFYSPSFLKMWPNCLEKFVSGYQGGSKALAAQAEKDMSPYLELKYRNLLTVHVNASWIWSD